MKDRRIGTFSLMKQEVENSPCMVRELMGKCIILKAEFEYYTECFKYLALNPDFAEVYIGAAPINYEIVIDNVAQKMTFDIRK